MAALTKAQLKQVLDLLQEKPTFSESICGYSVDIIARTSKYILLPFRIGADAYCKLDRTTGRYKHRLFVLATCHRKGAWELRCDELLEKYQRWIDEYWAMRTEYVTEEARIAALREAKIEALKEALVVIAEAYGDAQRDGCDPNGAWDCACETFNDKIAELEGEQ